MDKKTYLDTISPVELLLSQTTGTGVNYIDFKNSLNKLYYEHDVIRDVLSVFSFEAINNSNKALTIEINQVKINTAELRIPGGYFDSLNNKVSLSSISFEKTEEVLKNPTFSSLVDGIEKKMEIEKIPSLIHEITHAKMMSHFGNPSPYNTQSDKGVFQQVVRQVLLNVRQYIKDEFNFNIEIGNASNSVLGERITNMFFSPMSLRDSQSINKLINSYKEANLSIDKAHPWFKNIALLDLALIYQNYDLAESLVQNGARHVSESTIKKIVFLNNLAALEFIRNNDIEINQSSLTAKNVGELQDLACTNEFVKQLVTNIKANLEDSKVAESAEAKNLKALDDIMTLFDGSYPSSQMDAEFIVKLPEVIAAGLYNDKIANILKPLSSFWNENISPLSQESSVAYLESYTCSTLIDSYSPHSSEFLG